MPPGLNWLDYVTARGLRFRPDTTWADLPPEEQRRLTRNWRRWQRRRLARPVEPIRFVLRGDTVVVEEPRAGRRR